MYKLLSHNDLDGIGCGILAKLAFGDQVDVRYNSIASLNQEVEKFLQHEAEHPFLFITDLSVNEENRKKLETFYKKGGKVQLIDHHKTALHFNEHEWGYVSVEDEEGNLTSATSLLYEYLIQHNLLAPSNCIAEFVELVRQYDTWDWEKNDNQQAKKLNALFFLISMGEFEEKMINRLKSSDHFCFDEFEEKLLELEDNKIERYIRRKRRELVQTEINGFFAGVVYAESYHSELGNELGKEYPHLDYIAILNIGGKKVGFRTIHDTVDVSQIAGKYGGGGHAKASGCSLTAEAYKDFVTDTFPLDPIREDARKNTYNIKESPLGSMYENKAEDHFYLFPLNNKEWAIEQKKKQLPVTFSTFTEGESYLKRNHNAWLAKDYKLINYLMGHVKKKN